MARGWNAVEASEAIAEASVRLKACANLVGGLVSWPQMSVFYRNFFKKRCSCCSAQSHSDSKICITAKINVLLRYVLKFFKKPFWQQIKNGSGQNKI